ncbi:EscU/YscU/HrcU family type III secretion system export apparatus switch protein [Oceanobacillus chungangensis]|uniref:Type III secretion system protein n=1 Tax=Oceanobacillus chungangensis TaxID=1229152 RepID=A0A3D8PP18_9BACI|nr:EscU/YscU/HrcU family type III secretion system export apparatus switch protein [Oceanobacillus chungangensis]RDW17850.1 hypothetical protein CWR45_10990 [Oceanobacillus chungangensis]
MTEKRKKSVALKYEAETDYAPKVSATGKGIIAEEIIKKAKENNVPIIEDASLIELLAELNINEVIPEELYKVVAEVFAFIYRVDQNMEERDGK